MSKFNDKNRNPIFDITGFLCLLFAGILLLSYFSLNTENIDLNENRLSIMERVKKGGTIYGK